MHKRHVDRKKPLVLIVLSIIALFLADSPLKTFMPSFYRATKYGWDVPENTTCKRVIEGSPGRTKHIEIRYFKNGFKRWADLDTKKTKIFILGDSFTEMIWVSSGEEWYSYLQKKFTNSEFFVYGARGFSSLQEFMVLSDYIEKIKPDIIILQFCSNDFCDNLYALDLKWYPFNNHGVRPYLENGRIVYRLTVPLSWLRAHSFTADLLLYIYDGIMRKISARNFLADTKRRRFSLERAAKRDKELQRLNNEAVIVTEKIMNMIKRKTGNIPVYFLDVSNPDDPRGKYLCEDSGFTYIPGIIEYLISKEKEGYCVTVSHDKHWNALGNKFIGEKLTEYFLKEGFK